MGSVGSTNANLAELLQTLSTESPQLSPILSTPTMHAALEKASPGDLVQLSDQALQLQQVALMFGSLDGTQPSGFTSVADSLFPALSAQGTSTQPDPIMQALESSLGIAGTADSASSSTPANQIATSASGFQAQELNALFAAAQPVDPLLNTLG
jgi:hypothetical protein